MKAGFGRREIQVELPTSTIYCKGTGKCINEILDRIYASVIIWEEGDLRGAFFTFDLLAVPSSFTATLRRRLESLGFNSEAVALNATHTHTAPTFCQFRGIEEIENFENKMEEICLKAVEEAQEDMEETTPYWGKSLCNLNVNRREIGRIAQINDLNAPSGNVDPEVTVLMFRRRRRPSIILVNYAAHPLTITNNPYVISADYPGRLVRYLEKTHKVYAQFLQGAAGNANIKIHGDDEVSWKAARILGEKVSEAIKRLKEISLTEVKAEVRRVNLPLDIDGTLRDQRKELNRLDGDHSWRSGP